MRVFNRRVLFWYLVEQTGQFAFFKHKFRPLCQQGPLFYLRFCKSWFYAGIQLFLPGDRLYTSTVYSTPLIHKTDDLPIFFIG